MTKKILLSLLNCSWQWMLLSGLIFFATSFVFRKSRRSNVTVHLLWFLSLLSLPILFGLNQFVPALSIDRNPVSELVQAKPIDVSGFAALTTDLPEISPVESPTQSHNLLLTGDKSFFNWETTADLLVYVWIIGALAMFVRFMFGLCRIYQLRRSAVAADDSYQTICQGLARQLNIKRPVTIYFSDRVTSPISFGWLSPSILIPRKLDLTQFELVAAHELAHVQRLDWLTNLFSHLVGVIFFFHPIYHLLNRQLVHLRERICDDWVIQLTGARKNYAQCLLDLVRRRDRGISLALSLNQPSQLESRIDSILKSDRRLDVQLKPRLRLIVATLLLICLPLLAMAQLAPLKTFQVSLFAQTPQESSENEPSTATPSDEQQEGEQKAADEQPSKNEESEKQPDEKKAEYVIIKEIKIKENDPDHDYAWVELRNLSDSEINLKGWKIQDIEFDNEDVKIPAGGYFLIIDPDLALLEKLGYTIVEDEQVLEGKKERVQAMEEILKQLEEDAELAQRLVTELLTKKDSTHKREQDPLPEEILKELEAYTESLQRLVTVTELLTEIDGTRKREQDLSSEEILKQAHENTKLIQQLLAELLTEIDGAHKREQDLSPEEILKQMQEVIRESTTLREMAKKGEITAEEEAAHIEKLLKQLEEISKRTSPPEGRVKRGQKNTAHYEKRLKELSEKVSQTEERLAEAKALHESLQEMVKKGEITAEEASEVFRKAFPRKREDR